MSTYISAERGALIDVLSQKYVSEGCFATTSRHLIRLPEQQPSVEHRVKNCPSIAFHQRLAV